MQEKSPQKKPAYDFMFCAEAKVSRPSFDRVAIYFFASLASNWIGLSMA